MLDVNLQTLPTISLFSGCGGLDLGVASSGFQTKVAVELEPYACEALRRNQDLRHSISPDHRFLQGCEILERDIRDVSSAEILSSAGLEVGEAALLVGGPPCVSFSVAGGRKGLQSEVGRLYLEYVRVLEEISPAAFIFENVKGLLSAAGEDGEAGGAFRSIVDALAAPGYSITWSVVDAADYGVPQHRHRLFVLGIRGTESPTFPLATHGDPSRIGLLGDAGILKPWSTTRDAIGDLPPAADYGTEPTVPNHVARRYSDPVLESFKETAPGKRNPRYKRDRLRWDAPAKTIRAQGKLKANGSGQRNSSHQSIHPSEHRQITVREAARIQTFPDWYVFDRTFVNGYRVVGDAVPPALAAVLGQAVRSELESVDVGSTLAAAA